MVEGFVARSQFRAVLGALVRIDAAAWISGLGQMRERVEPAGKVAVTVRRSGLVAHRGRVGGVTQASLQLTDGGPRLGRQSGASVTEVVPAQVWAADASAGSAERGAPDTSRDDMAVLVGENECVHTLSGE